jgi:hypothetical protein
VSFVRSGDLDGTAWLDGISNNGATGTFNDVPVVINKGAVSRRSVLAPRVSRKSSGEHVVVIAVGGTNTDLKVQQPCRNAPYFKVSALGWYWRAAGNCFAL